MSEELAKVIPIDALLDLDKDPSPIRSDQVLEIIARMIERDASPVREALAEVIRIGHALQSELPSLLMATVLGQAEKTQTGMPAKVTDSIDRMRKRLRPWSSASKDSTDRQKRIDDAEKERQKRIERAQAELLMSKDKELAAARAEADGLRDSLSSLESRFDSLRREVYEKIVPQQVATSVDCRRITANYSHTPLFEALTMISARHTSGSVRLHRFDEKNRCVLCELSATEMMRLRSSRPDGLRRRDDKGGPRFGFEFGPEEISSFNSRHHERASLLLCSGQPGVVVSVDGSVESQFT